MPRYDFVTLGETMLRLTPPGFQRLEQAKQLNLEVVGSESNTAVGLARLGCKVAWLSRLPRNPLGHVVAQTLRGYGVNTEHVIWSEDARLGLYFWEDSLPPRPNLALYDRRDSAMSHIRPDMLPEALFAPEQARVLHMTGITPALSDAARATTQTAAEMAGNAGWQLTFDLNFRSQLWSPAQARSACDPLARLANILISPYRDALTIYDLPPDTSHETALRFLKERYPQAIIILTLGEEGAMGCDHSGNIVSQPAFSSQVVDRLGGGDAFTAGLLYSYYLVEAGHNRLAMALRWGTAMAAVKRSIKGDLPLVDKRMVAELVSAETTRLDVR